MIAITRAISPGLNGCELTYRHREPIDVTRASVQHDRYEQALREAGCRVIRLPADPASPDSVFVEDAAVVLHELAVVTRPGATSRRGETAAIADALMPYRSLRRIEEPATLDGGDVLIAGRRVFVGESGRTNTAAIDQLGRILAPYGYDMRTVPITGCLHLKSAATLVDERTVLINPERLPSRLFEDFELVQVDPAEPDGANVLRINEHVICPSTYPRTRERLEQRGVTILSVDVGELIKAEGAVTCCSLVFDER